MSASTSSWEMNTVFADSLRQAALTFPNQTISFAQIRLVGRLIKVRLQAIEIMKQFEGDVTYGNDPRGILFYTSLSDFPTSRVLFTYNKLREQEPNQVCIQIDFKRTERSRAFARFVARVDTSKYQIPQQHFGAGIGFWQSYYSATTDAHVFRDEDSPNVYLQIGPIGREVVFASERGGEFSINGLFMFRNLDQLQDEPIPGDQRKMHVSYDSDTIVFRFEPNTGDNMEFGLFLPNLPLVNIGSASHPPEAKWYPFTADPGSYGVEDTIGDASKETDV